MFNSLKYAKKLEEAGVPREQAETHLMILSEVMEENLATSQELKDFQVDTRENFVALRTEMKVLVSELRTEMKDLGTELRTEIKDLGTEMRLGFASVEARFIQLEQRMTIKFGTMLTLAMGVMVAIQKLI